MSVATILPTGGTPPVLGIVLGGVGTRSIVVRDNVITADRNFADADPIKVLESLAATDPSGITLNLGGFLSSLLSGGTIDEGVAVVRIAPRAAVDSRLERHPRDRVERLVHRRFTVPGGHDLFGRELRQLDLGRAREVADEIADLDVRAVAVVGSGSTADPSHERQVADILQSRSGCEQTSLASSVGGQGFLARESTVVHDAALSGPLQALLGVWVDAVAQRFPDCPLRIARCDGGWSAVPWILDHPVIALASDVAMHLLGAAAEAGERSCRVHIETAAGAMLGEVRANLVTVGIHAWAALADPMGWDLVVPQPELTPVFAPSSSATNDPEHGVDATLPLIRSSSDLGALIGLGSAVSRPTAWLDEVAQILTVAELIALQENARARLIALATTSGAAPGTATVIDMSTIAVPYSPAGTVRITARATGSPELRVDRSSWRSPRARRVDG